MTSQATPKLTRPGASAGAALLLAVLAFGAALVVDPRGDFPLNDDWSYGVAARRLLEEHRFRPTGWTAMTLVSQALWGALFCWPTGFSFTALRLSTLVLAWAGACGIFVTAVDAGRPRVLAWLVALTLAFNPLWFALSYTFMTDVPFAAWSTLAAVFLARGVRHDAGTAHANTGWAALWTTVALLCRQSGAVLPLGFAVARASDPCPSRRTWWQITWLKLVTRGSWAVAALLTLVVTLNGLGVKALALSAGVGVGVPRVTASQLASRAESLLVYLGLFLLPILVLLGQPRGSSARLARIAGASCATLIGAHLVLTGRTMPLMRHESEANILDLVGIGPVTLRDAFILGLPGLEPLPPTLWMTLTLAGVVGAGVLLAHVVHLAWLASRPAADGRAPGRLRFFLVTAALYAVPVAAAPHAFDRYFLPLVPLLMGALLHAPVKKPKHPRARTGLAFTLVVAMAIVAMATTRDYLEWNRARWRALGDLLSQAQVQPEHIDGGFEFNGLYLYRSGGPRRGSAKSWWWVEDDEYLVTLSALPGYRTVATYPFQRWLPPRPSVVRVVRRHAPVTQTAP